MIKDIIKNLVSQSSEILDECITTKEEKLEAKRKIQELLKTHKKQMYELEVEDRKSARDMYKDDSLIQKILATIFTMAYFVLSFVLARYFILGDINLGEFEISFISTLFGAMSAKINTIIDFYYGTGTNQK